MADWTGTSPLAMRLISTLEDTVATAKIYFSIRGFLITPYYLSQVARAIREGKIGIGLEVEVPGTSSYYSGIDPSKAGTPQDEGNFFLVDLPYSLTVNTDYINNRALAIHEAVHAVHDMFSRPITALDDEASGYIAQAVYCLDNSQEHRDKWKKWLGKGDLSAEACPLALRVLDGICNVDQLFPDEYLAFRRKITLNPKYRRLTTTDMSGCNGIGGFRPDRSPDGPGGLGSWRL
jgi:hypothetical protein